MTEFKTIEVDADLTDELASCFLEKVSMRPSSEGGCWIWTGYKNRKGYGRIKFNGSMFYAHRISYTLFVAAVPSNRLCCHTCDNPSCVNPKHLFLGTWADNTHDMVAKGRHHEQKKTHCANGHEYTEDNIYWSTRVSRKNPQRKCKICTRAVMNRHNARKRAEKDIQS